MANWCILHGHGHYGSGGKRSYIIIRCGYKSKESAKATAMSGRYGDVAGDHRIVKNTKIKQVVENGKKVKGLYEVKSLFRR